MTATTESGQARALGHKVISVKPCDDYTLHIVFSNGEERIFNAQYLLKSQVFAPLNNIGFFKLAKPGIVGELSWPGEIDLCYDTVYEKSTPVKAVSPKSDMV